MSHPTTAVLSIDVQQSFLARDYWSDTDVLLFRQRMVELIDGAVARSWPVVRVLHVDADGAFSLAGGLVKPMDWVPTTHAVEFIKHVHNAFTDTGLDRWLRGRGIQRLLVAGIRTEQCCETTTRVASDLGYDVDFVSEATLTFAMTDPVSGRTYSASDIRERTELVLRGRFARIVTVEQALAQA